MRQTSRVLFSSLQRSPEEMIQILLGFGFTTVAFPELTSVI